MTGPLRVVEYQTEAQREVVDALRGLLARAEAGEIQGFAVAAACEGRHTASSFVIGNATIADLYLGIERVKSRLLSHGWDE